MIKQFSTKMKFTIASLLFAACAVAIPANVQRDNTLQISEFRASTSIIDSASMHFVVTDANYPDDTPTDCNLLWQVPSSIHIHSYEQVSSNREITS